MKQLLVSSVSRASTQVNVTSSHRPSFRQIRACKRTALSLMETTAATALTAILVVTSMSSLNFVTNIGNRAGALNQAAQAAQYLLCEICEKNYCEPGNTSTTIGYGSGESPTMRNTLDDVDDYNGFNYVALTDRDGYYLPGMIGWRGSVVVRFVSISDINATSSTDTGLKRIDLTLTSPKGQKYVYSALRTSWGPLSKPVQGSGVQLQTSAEFTGQYRGNVWRAAARLNNQQRVSSTGTTP